MLDSYVQPRLAPTLEAVGLWLEKRGARPLILLWTALLAGTLAGFCLLYRHGLAGIVFFAVALFCVGAAAGAARRKGESTHNQNAFAATLCLQGLFAAMPFCVSAGIDSKAAWACTSFYLFGFCLVGCARLGEALVAARAHKDVFAFAEGFADHTACALFAALCMLAAPLYPVLAGLFGALCVADAILRAARVAQADDA